jgi:hypothetical protein
MLHLLRHGTSVFKIRLFLLLNALLKLAKKQLLPILNVLGLTRPAQAGLEFRTSSMISESTITRLPQPVNVNYYHATSFDASDAHFDN